MEEQKLTAQVRVLTGKKCHQLLRKGIIPAIVDQKGKPSLPIQINARDLASILHTEAGPNVLLRMDIQGEGKRDVRDVVIKKLHRNPITHQVRHVDFHAVSLKEKIVSHVPIQLVGSADHIKDQGGRIEQVLHEIEVRSLPDHIPAHLEIDISRLNPGEMIHAGDVPLPEGVELVTPREAILVIGRGKHVELLPKEEEEKPAAEAPAGEQATPEA